MQDQLMKIYAFFLAANKSDLKRKIPKQKINKFVEDYNILFYTDTSCFNGEGIELLFNNITQELLK